MQVFLIALIIILLIYFFLIQPIRAKMKKKEEEGEIKEGIVIHWKDQEGLRNFVDNDRNMIAGWGKVKVYSDGDIEYLPDSNRGRIYRGEHNWDFNPYLESAWRKLEMLKREGYEVFWADGTDKYRSPKTFKVLMEEEQ